MCTCDTALEPMNVGCFIQREVHRHERANHFLLSRKNGCLIVIVTARINHRCLNPCSPHRKSASQCFSACTVFTRMSRIFTYLGKPWPPRALPGRAIVIALVVAPAAMVPAIVAVRLLCETP